MWRRLLVAWVCIIALAFAAGTASAASSAPAKPHQGTSEFSAALNVCANALVTLQVHSGNHRLPTAVMSDVPDAARGSSKAIQPYWPPNLGFAGTPTSTTLAPGTRIDRYGSELGTFASPAGTPFGARSLPADAASAPLRGYEVLKPLPAQGGTTARWFGQLGGGTQYEFAQSVESLVQQGFLRRVP